MVSDEGNTLPIGLQALHDLGVASGIRLPVLDTMRAIAAEPTKGILAGR